LRRPGIGAKAARRLCSFGGCEDSGVTDLSIGAALDRLSAWLERPEAQAVRASLRGPATDTDLEALRRVIAPHELPEELVAVLRWHNGQQGHEEDTPDLLPIAQGTLKGTPDIPDSYEFLTRKCEPYQWCPLWVPIQQHRWSQSGVASVQSGPSVVIEADFGDPDQSIVSSSLAALLHAVADLAEDGMLKSAEVSGPVYRAWYKERSRLIEKRAEEFGWEHWPHERVMVNDEEAINWPEEWRAAAGFGEPTAPGNA